jgi:hypothetical protein
MKVKLTFFLLIFIFILVGCDLLRFSPFEVTSWTPGEGYHSNPENLIVSLTFSLEPDYAAAERNFTLTANGNRVRGNFSWEDFTMTFTPLTPLEINTDYTINLSADARNTEGLSMDEAFIKDFTTRQDNVRPVLVSCYPPMYAEINDLIFNVRLEFSVSIPLNALYNNVSFRPSMTGLWHLENNEKLAVFTPSEHWTQNTRYEIHLSSSFSGTNGMNIGSEFISIFTTGIDKEPPVLLNVWRITGDGDLIQLNPDRGYSGAAESPVHNEGWERNDRFFAVFSKPVDSLSVNNFLAIEDGPNLIMETPPGYKSEYYFRFENPPAYDGRFTLRIRPGIRDNTGNETAEEYIFKNHVNGVNSKPPFLAGIRIPMAPGNDIDYESVYFTSESLYENIPITDTNYPSGLSVNTWFELYFVTTQEASIDIFSLMELFRIETSNNVITFSPRQIKTNNFTFDEPQDGLEHLQRVEITGNLINSTNFGIINFRIAPGLRDSFGNSNENMSVISLIK